jgi:hypothetical protein
MDKYFKVALLVCAVIMTLIAVLWFVFQAKHFLAAPDGIFFFGLGIFVIVMNVKLVILSLKELREGK